MHYIGSIYKIYSNKVNVVYIGICVNKLNIELERFKTKYKTKYNTFITAEPTIELLEDVYSEINNNQILIIKRQKHILSIKNNLKRKNIKTL